MSLAPPHRGTTANKSARELRFVWTILTVRKRLIFLTTRGNLREVLVAFYEDTVSIPLQRVGIQHYRGNPSLKFSTARTDWPEAGVPLPGVPMHPRLRREL